MRHARPLVLALLICALPVLPACAGKPASYLADETRRQEVIDALAADPAMRMQLFDRILQPGDARGAVIESILKDKEAVDLLVQRILSDDRGKALVVSRVTADDAGAKTFVRMLMLSGAMGTAMSQAQADAIGLGEAFALGNQRRTMADMKRIGALLEVWARGKQGAYPVCGEFGAAAPCLERHVPGDQLGGLRLEDAWGTPLQYHADREGTTYALISFASDREYDGLGKVGPTESFDCDIVFTRGDFIQWPGRIRKSDIR